MQQRLSTVSLIPLDVVQVVLGDLVDVEELVSGECEVEAAPKSHLPQFLGSLVCVQTAVAQQEANYQKKCECSEVHVAGVRLETFPLKSACIGFYILYCGDKGLVDTPCSCDSYCAVVLPMLCG